MKIKLGQVAAVLLAAMTAGCANDEAATGTTTDGVRLQLDVVEAGWQEERVSVTRSGETMEGLKAVSGSLPAGYGYGFCLRGTNLLGAPGVSRQVTWDDAKGQWDAGNDIYWLRTSGGETFNVYAYAPNNATDTYEEIPNSPSTLSPESWKGEITFSSAADGRNVDLLYAAAEVKRSDGLARLTFRHALAKISFGTITNSTGEAISLKQVSLGGELEPSGTLNLMTGAWTCAEELSTTTITRVIDTDAEVDGNQPLGVANGAIVPIPVDAFLLIPLRTADPKKTVTITLTIGRAAGSDETFSFTTTLEQGKNKTFNVTVEKNFEVVIDG